MSKFFEFGEKIEEYTYKVINERDARASAGIMFLFGIISLFSVLLTKDIFLANFFTITFILEFIIRIGVNPKYAPYMVLGSLIVSNQDPDWVEAKPKKFAWIFGLGLGVVMSYFIFFDIITPSKLLICVLCLSLLYIESVFGICLGCIIYKQLNINLYKCAGGTCSVLPKKKRLIKKSLILLFYIGLFFGMYYALLVYKEYKHTQINKSNTQMQSTDCQPPQWAIDIGHKDMWLKHHGCKK